MGQLQSAGGAGLKVSPRKGRSLELTILHINIIVYYSIWV